MEFYKDMEYKEVSKRIAYKGKRLLIEELKYKTQNNIINREHVISGDAVVILPITENNEVIMIQETRTPIEKIIYELPAGMIEKGESPEQAALRELEEETGYKAKNLEFLNEYYPSVGYSNEKISIFLATNFIKTHQKLDEDEQIEVHKIPLEDVIKAVKNNELKTASVLIAVMHYLLYKKEK